MSTLTSASWLSMYVAATYGASLIKACTSGGGPLSSRLFAQLPSLATPAFGQLIPVLHSVRRRCGHCALCSRGVRVFGIGLGLRSSSATLMQRMTMRKRMGTTMVAPLAVRFRVPAGASCVSGLLGARRNSLRPLKRKMKRIGRVYHALFAVACASEVSGMLTLRVSRTRLSSAYWYPASMKSGPRRCTQRGRLALARWLVKDGSSGGGIAAALSALLLLNRGA
ncbi:MAG: hypothetical protein FuTV4_gp1 [Hangzhou tombusvirus 1]|nr:MAG: hypothetical protein FuTV4_gp1 [Hangzhou tombusvirus 1]